MINRLCFSLFIFMTCQAVAFEVLSPLSQGALIQIQVDPDESIRVGDTKVLTHNNIGFFGVDKEAATLTIKSTKTGAHVLPVHKTPWKKEVINGLDHKKVVLSPENQQRVKQENAALWVSRDTPKFQSFPTCFIRPTNRPVSSPFGGYRVLNGVKTAGHGGTDYRVPIGEDVVSSADGLVRIVHDDMFYTGKTVLIDHGGGLFASYSHLDSIFVKEGQTVKAGTPIGASGQTGRATGPHLHYSFFWFNTRVDPENVFVSFPCPDDSTP